MTFPLAQLALRLATFATRTGGPLPLLDGSSALLGLTGMAYLPRPRQKPAAPAWFRQTPTAKALADNRRALGDWADQQTTEPADQRDYALVVQWRRLLSKALLRHDSTAGVPPALRRLAHQTWWALLPLIQRYDVVLAQLLEAARSNYDTNPTRAEHEPFWVGFDTTDDELRLDAQVTALLASRRTDKHPVDGFCDEMARWLAEGFRVAVVSSAQRTVGLCTVNNHTRNAFCETCPEIARERRYMLVLDVPTLLDQRSRRLITAPPTPAASGGPSVMRDNLRWIIDSRSRLDGTVRFTHSTGAPARFIDIQRLRQRWAALQMPTMFDDLPPPEQLDGSRQAQAFFETRLKHAVIPPQSYSAEDLYVQAGWGNHEDYATTYSQFTAVFESTLLTALQQLDQRAYALLQARNAQMRVPTARKIERRLVTRRYTRLDTGRPATIEVLRGLSTGRVRRNFYTLPYDVDVPAARRGKVITHGEKHYWSWHAINELANEGVGEIEPTYPWARAFCEWVGEQEVELNDDKLFQDAIYSERLPQRLAAIARGDQAHLGVYSDAEDEIIREFFFRPTTKKRLSPQDWQPLLEKLPGRNELGVLKRFEALGKKYAFEHGYQEYKASPYFRKFAAKRRAQWIKEGCPP